MLVTLVGMVMSASFVHPLNTFDPMEVVEDESVTLVNAEQF